MSTQDIRTLVKETYGQAAVRAATGGRATCGSTCSGKDPITSDLYQPEETGGLPPEALAASLGCGNPTALAELHPGETVLDLGSGVASTCCFLPSGSALLAKPTAWI